MGSETLKPKKATSILPFIRLPSGPFLGFRLRGLGAVGHVKVRRLRDSTATSCAPKPLFGSPHSPLSFYFCPPLSLAQRRAERLASLRNSGPTDDPPICLAVAWVVLDDFGVCGSATLPPRRVDDSARGRKALDAVHDEDCAGVRGLMRMVVPHAAGASGGVGGTQHHGGGWSGQD